MVASVSALKVYLICFPEPEMEIPGRVPTMLSLSISFLPHSLNVDFGAFVVIAK